MTRYYNKHVFKSRRKELRNESTIEEVLLWKQLQKSKVKGRKFRRQHSVGAYILDFYCPEEKLCIELDGSQHFEMKQKEHDEERTRFLMNFGIRVLRFRNEEILYNMQSVLMEIEKNFIQ